MITSALKDGGRYGDYTVASCQNVDTAAKPSPRNIDLRAAMKQANAPTNYGMIMVDENGDDNGLEFSMNIAKQMYKQSNLAKVEEVGTWDTRNAMAVKYKAGAALEGFAATNVYKVVTVIVSWNCLVNLWIDFLETFFRT